MRAWRVHLATAAAAAPQAISILPTAPWAQCVPDNPAPGDTVTCTGNPNGFATDGLGSLTVDILSGGEPIGK